ncbi:MAG: translation initiation factor IF-2 subunit gamma [Candidatus Micrarchaeota archaeon]
MPQSELNIMTCGHVDHGKTTIVHAMTGKFTDTHSEEIKRGITIKLGYADLAVRKCDKCGSYTQREKCERCILPTREARRISLVDAPGHETLMATVVAASSIVDGALFIIAANEKCPQPQTLEHLLVLDAIGIKKAIIVQTKVDLVTREQALQNYKEIKELVNGTRLQDSPIIPVSAVTGTNVDKLTAFMQEYFTAPQRDENAAPMMYIARSFDVNVPGTKVEKITGGVLGGSIARGVLNEGDEVEIRPGYLTVKKERESYTPIRTTIASLNAGGATKHAKPGGLVGVATLLDPALTRSDALVGNIIGKPGSMPEVLNEADLKIKPIKRTSVAFADTFVENEPLVIGIGTATTVGFVKGKSKQNKKAYQVVLKKPICGEKGSIVALLRRSTNRWHFYGTAEIV